MYKKLYDCIIKRDEEIKQLALNLEKAERSTKTNYITNTNDIIENQKKNKKITEIWKKQKKEIERRA